MKKAKIFTILLFSILFIGLAQATTLSDNTSTFTGNINMTGYNLTGSNIFANVNWSYIQNIPSYVKDWNSSGLIINWSNEINLSNYLTSTQINALPISTFTNDLGYITGTYGNNTYYLKSNPFNFYNSTTIPNYALNSSLSNYYPLNNPYGYYNSSDFLISNYFTKSDILGFNYFNASDFNISNYALNSSLSNYFAKSQITGFNYFNKTGGNYLYSTGNTIYVNESYLQDNFASSNTIFYFYNTSSTISTYNTMNRTVSDYTEKYVTYSLVTNNQELATYINPTTNISYLDEGVYEIHIHAYDPLGKNKAGIYAKIYKRYTNGTEVLLSTTKNSSILTNTEQNYLLEGSLLNQVDFNKTDYLVVKFYSYTIGTGSSVRFGVEGSTNARFSFNANINVAIPFYAGTGAYAIGNTFYLNDTYVKQLFSATAPIVYNSTSGAFSITQATTSTNGSLSSTDWNTFNNKIDWSQATNGTLALSSDIPTNNNQLINGNNYWNSTFAGFNKTYADTLYQPIGSYLNKTYADTLYYPLNNPYGYYNSSDFLISDYFTKSQILGFGYYNASSFDINNYYLKSNPYGFYNSSDFVISDYYLKSNPYGFYNSTTIPNFALNSSLSTVAFTGAYSDLTGLPTIPTNNNQLINGNGYYNASNFLISDYYTQTSANATFVKKSGDTMTGNLNMNSNNVTSVDCVVFSNGGKWCSA